MAKLKYKYTIDDGIFTDDQRKFYEENGYIVFKKLISHADIDVCIKRFLEICDGKENDVMIIMKDYSLIKNVNVKGEFLINKLQDILHEDIFFNRYAINKEIVKVIRSIIGSNITAVSSMLINKPPDADYDYSRHPLHQDLHYFPFRPANNIVASWTAMEKINEENGCLFVVPGSHKCKLFPHVYPSDVKNKAYHGVQGFDHVPRINLIMEKGDTVFFHPLLLHGSGPNLSNGFRKAISVHYANTNCQFFDVRGTVQENIAKEVEEIAFRKSGIILKFEDIWRHKSKLVIGDPGNFHNFSSNL